jgi:phenylpropionate dioxygenase-like ring-hydroxylating dioxygenase large terminal subunit
MNSDSTAQAYWWPLAAAPELTCGAVLPRTLLGMPLVLFRTADGTPAALPDRCPHRAAPLSRGTVRNGEVECPYHGWRFDGEGRCTRVPGGSQTCSPKPLLAPLNVCEHAGLVWASLPGDPPVQPPATPPASTHPMDVFFLSDTIRCTLAEAAENFLDAFHTHFVHAGWIRSDTRRQKIRAKVRRLPDGIEARYSEEGLQSGWISQLLERERGESFGRFRMPGLAEIEYRNRKGGVTLLISAWLTPAARGQIQLLARVATPAGWLPGLVKEAVLRRVFAVIQKQDKRILELTTANRERFAEIEAAAAPAEPLSGALDLLGPHIRELLGKGRLQAAEDKETEVFL